MKKLLVLLVGMLLVGSVIGQTATYSNGESIGLTINNFENAWNSKELETFN